MAMLLTMQTHPDELWTVEEVARFLRVSRSWVYKASSRGDLPCIRIGPMVRFNPAAIRMAIDLERQAERIRLGLEPAPTTGPTMTFAHLYDWWWTEYGSKRRGIKNGSIDAFNRKRLLPLLGQLAAREVTAAKIEEM